MTPGKTKLKNLASLRMEKNKLQLYCSYQEKLIGLKIDSFRANYPKILGESLLPYDEDQNIRVNSLLDSVNDLIAKLFPGIFRGRILPGILMKLLQVLVLNLVSKKK